MGDSHRWNAEECHDLRRRHRGGNQHDLFHAFRLTQKKMGREHRGLAKFDLWTALFIPYVVATTCVVIAAGTSFNGKPESAYIDFERKNLKPDLEKGVLSLSKG